MTRARQLLNLFETTNDQSGSDFGVLYHGGPKLIRAVDPSKLQKRDHGLYGKGFYLTLHPDLAKGYGSRVTRVKLDPQARVLYLNSYSPKDENPQLREAVYKYIIDYNEPKMIQADYSPERIQKFKTIVQNVVNGDDHTIWLDYIDRYATAMNYDVIYYGPCEIVVKNPDVLQFQNKVRNDKS